jgi:sporulation protein YlmC with PRC-barrel domain
MARKDRGPRDQAGVGPHRRDGIRLAPMSKLKWDVADGEPDIRGWEVKTLSGHEIGEVNDLLVDTNAGEVVMLDIDIKGSRDHTLAPIRAAQIDREGRVVRIDSADVEPGAMPSLRRDGASDEDARQFHERYSRAYGNRGWDNESDYIVERDGDEVLFTRRGREEEADDRPDRELPREEPRSDNARRDVRYGRRTEADEQVIERRPVVFEEVVVRRRVVDDDDSRSAADPDRNRDGIVDHRDVGTAREEERGRDVL